MRSLIATPVLTGTVAVSEGHPSGGQNPLNPYLGTNSQGIRLDSEEPRCLPQTYTLPHRSPSLLE